MPTFARVLACFMFFCAFVCIMVAFAEPAAGPLHLPVFLGAAFSASVSGAGLYLLADLVDAVRELRPPQAVQGPSVPATAPPPPPPLGPEPLPAQTEAELEQERQSMIKLIVWTAAIGSMILIGAFIAAGVTDPQ